MNLERLNLEKDEVPSFQAIVEQGLQSPQPCEVNMPLGPDCISADILSRLLPQYQGWEFLGMGGMGVVYKAWHRELHRWAAVKLLSPTLGTDARALARFQNEAAVLAQLRHPNIVPVHDFGCEGEVAWLVMDFVNGVPLQKWALQQPRKPSELARMVAKIARAAGVAHASGITHRDLKPGNILVLNDEPVLLDFGLAQNSGAPEDIRLTQVGELAGTVAYLAPEQVDPSLGLPSPSTDVHACGVILFELLAGRLPRTGLVGQIITRLHEDDRPPRLKSVATSISRELDAICWLAMQKRPEDRYANGISLAEDLERFLDGRPVRAKNPDAVDMAYLFVRRYPWAVAATGVVLLAVLMTGWSAMRMQHSQHKARLLSQINRQLTEHEWTLDRLALVETLLLEMHEVDTVLERHLNEDILKRTERAILERLDAPRLSEKQGQEVEELLHFLSDKQHPRSASLVQRWRARESAWQPVVDLQSPITPDAARAVFRPEGWEVVLGCLTARPARPEETWSTLVSHIRLAESVEVEMEYDDRWQEAKACGMTLRIPLLKDLRFLVFKADRFAQYRPEFENPEQAQVMAILSEGEPLVYAILPKEVRDARHLTLRCRYENGDVFFSANHLEPLHYTNVFELARPLADANFTLLLPTQTRLARLEVRQRQNSAPATPLAKADDLVGQGKPEEALAIYEKYLHRDDVKTECLYKQAACLEALQKPAEAISGWQQVARWGGQPWKSLAMYQLWRCHLIQGDMETANSWFDLLLAGKPPDLVQAGIPTSDRLLLNQHYLPVTRSLNCLKARPQDMPALDRAVRVQQFLGASPAQLAMRTAMAFHFAGRDARARQLFNQAATAVRPSASLPGGEIQQTLASLDHWAALGNADGDAVLQASLTAWRHALKGSHIPAGATLWLEDARHELRQGLPFKAGHRNSLEEIANDDRVPMRHRVEARLLLGEAAEGEERETAWEEALKMMDSSGSRADRTQQCLHAEFALRGMTAGWTPRSASEWLASLLQKSQPLTASGQWASPLIQSLDAAVLAHAWNQVMQSPRGRQFARDFVLRSRPARDLAREGMHLVLAAIFAEGSRLPLEHADVERSAGGAVEAFVSGTLTEAGLMQMFQLWSGIKTPATWELLCDALPASLRQPLAALLMRRYENLGQPGKAAEFLPTAATAQKSPR